MRLVTASVLSMLACVPALADARLPVVNIAAGAVSARAAFGESVAPKSETVTVAPLKRVAAATESTSKTAPAEKQKTVVARATKQTKPTTSVQPVASERASVDNGAQIALNNAMDVLSPRRPSADLWAKMDSPLRLPQPQEFSVIRSDNALPEESLDGAPVQVAAARPQPAAPVKSDMAPASANARSGALDAEIAKLVELQKKADESVRRAPVAPRVAAAPVADVAPAPVRVAKTVTARPAVKSAPRVVDEKSDDDITISRMVVPMESDVVVRQVAPQDAAPRVAAVRDDLSKMSPSELKKAFKKTYLSENKHLSTFQIDDRFDVASDLTSDVEG
ncbi:MAG: hypothetical protein K2L94_01270, partial [Alphaproteobacteria bacterium]|nr:hypothetical protein [Alphaproteobacteria bacterium]